MRCGNWIRVVIVLLALLAGNAVTAQERFGGLAGIVTDASQAPVPGATITITNKQTGATRTAVSGPDGGYRISDLEPGRYAVAVELQGFQKIEVDDVLVLLGKTAEFPASLKVGGLAWLAHRRMISRTGPKRPEPLGQVSGTLAYALHASDGRGGGSSAPAPPSIWGRSARRWRRWLRGPFGLLRMGVRPIGTLAGPGWQR